MGRLTLLVALLSALTACSAPTPPAAVPAGRTADLATSSSAPAHLTYPAIGVNSDVLPTGLNPDGSIHVPALDHAAEVDYLDWGAAIGRGRPLIFLSHVNGRDQAGHVIPGGFGKLSHAAVGDRVTVTGRSGAEATYHVVTVRTVPKNAFPASIYDPTATPSLVLITCGGQIVDHNYLSNVVVTATL